MSKFDNYLTSRKNTCIITVCETLSIISYCVSDMSDADEIKSMINGMKRYYDETRMFIEEQDKRFLDEMAEQLKDSKPVIVPEGQE